MREVSFGDLEVEIMRQVKKWRDELLEEYSRGGEIAAIDAGDAAKLAGNITLEVIWPGIQIVGPAESTRRLNEGWG